MRPLIINCWPVRIVKHAAKHAIKRRPRRLHHHARRAAGFATSKPAVIGYVCVAVGGIGGTVSIFSPSPEAPRIDTQAIGGGFDIESFGPTAPQFPLLSPGLPPVIGPTLPPETPTMRIPEPGSALLLATAVVAAIAAIRGRG
jgi:hypothetical protein